MICSTRAQLAAIAALSASVISFGAQASAVTIVGGKVIGSRAAVSFVDSTGESQLVASKDEGHELQIGYNLPIEDMDTQTWQAAISKPAASYKKGDEVIFFSMDEMGFK